MDTTPEQPTTDEPIAYEAPAIEEQASIVGLLGKTSSGRIILD